MVTTSQTFFSDQSQLFMWKCSTHVEVLMIKGLFLYSFLILPTKYLLSANVVLHQEEKVLMQYPPLESSSSTWEMRDERLIRQVILRVVVSSKAMGSSVQFSRSVVSNSLRPHESQHARPPCPSPIPGVYSDSCPSIRWCHPAISSSVVPFSSCPQSLPASGSFPMSQLFASGGQSIGVSALAWVLSMNTQDQSPLEWTG